MPAKPTIDSRTTRIYIHPMLFIWDDFSIPGVVAAFDEADEARYWYCLSAEPPEKARTA